MPAAASAGSAPGSAAGALPAATAPRAPMPAAAPRPAAAPEEALLCAVGVVPSGDSGAAVSTFPPAARLPLAEGEAVRTLPPPAEGAPVSVGPVEDVPWGELATACPLPATRCKIAGDVQLHMSLLRKFRMQRSCEIVANFNASTPDVDVRTPGAKSIAVVAGGPAPGVVAAAAAAEDVGVLAVGAPSAAEEAEAAATTGVGACLPSPWMAATVPAKSDCALGVSVAAGVTVCGCCPSA